MSYTFNPFTGQLDDIGADGSDENNKVGVDAAATANYLGAASNDGVLRVDSTLDYTDGGDFITLGLDSTLKTNYDTAYTHSQDNTQAHTDYLVNNANDTTSGVLTAAGFVTDGDITVDSTPGTDQTVSGIKAVFTANENQVFGDVGYINTDGEIQLGDADAIATSNIVAMCADASISADASGNYLLIGFAREDSWTWTVGGKIYLSLTGTSTNTLTQTAPSASGDIVQILGVATHADRMYFNPNLVQVEIA